MLLVSLKKTDFNTKVAEIKGKILDVSSLVKEAYYTTDITSIKNDYVTNAAPNYKKRKFDTEVKKNNDKIASDSSEVLLYNNRLKQVKNRIDGLERYASYLRGKIFFDGDDGTQNALVFQVKSKYFIRCSGFVATCDIWSI